MTTDLQVTRGEGHVCLTLNRPERRNALSVALRDAVSDALDEIAADHTVKAVVITGAGAVFCAGFDLGEFDRAAEDEKFMRTLWDSSDRFHRTVWGFPLPTVAAVNGPAVAGGFDLAVMCDLRVAADTASFSHPERAFGDVVYGPLYDLVGGALARELTMGGRKIDARQALEMHLVSSVSEPAGLMEDVSQLLDRVCGASREVLVRTKQKALRRTGFDPTAATLDL